MAKRGRPRKMENLFNAPSKQHVFTEGNKSPGILDDFAVRKVMDTQEGTITKVPVNNYDIVNKAYVDAAVAPIVSDTNFWLSGGGILQPITSSHQLSASNIIIDGTISGGVITGTDVTISKAGDNYLKIVSTDHNKAGIKLVRATEADIYNDWHIYDDGGSLLFDNSVSGSASERFRITSDGKVGIGTSNPDSSCHLEGTDHTYLVIGSSGANDLDRGLAFHNAAGDAAGYITLVPNTAGTDSMMNFYVGGGGGGDVGMAIDDDGNITVRGTVDGIDIAARDHDAVTLNASATTGGLSISTQEISHRAATNAQTGYATAAHITAIEANTLSCGTIADISAATLTNISDISYLSGTVVAGDIADMTYLSGTVVAGLSGNFDTLSAAYILHAADASNPHGATLTQTNLTCTGNVAFEKGSENEQVIFNDLSSNDPGITFLVDGDTYYSMGVDDTDDTFKISLSQALETDTVLTIDESGNISVAQDNTTLSTGIIRNIILGTDATPPAASGYVHGTLYVQYTA